MRLVYALVSLLFAVACDEPIKPLYGDVPDADLCALSAMAWSETWERTESPEHPLVYDDLTLHLEPVAVGDAALDLALCFSGDVTWSALGASGTTTIEDAARDGWVGEITGGGYLTADDGTLPCVGITAGLAGELADSVEFAEGSYWWEKGDDRDAVGEAANGEILEAGALLRLDLPEKLAEGLGLSETVHLAAALDQRWDDPLCVAAE